MIRYEFRSPRGETAEQLIELSGLWAEENCCHGMLKNQAEDLSEPLAVALEDDRIVGYIMGHYYFRENRTSYIDPGSRCFSVDELYVRPEYRCRGIGKNLFTMLQQRVCRDCEYITLATSAKNYKSILKLYVEELGMDFHSAFLIKKIPNIGEEGTICE